MTNKGKTAERRVADAVLQKKMKVTVGDRDFEVARPTIATLYEVSAIVSELADVEADRMPDNMQDIITGALGMAHHAPVHAAALAMLILGAREQGYVEEVKTTETAAAKPSLLGRMVSGKGMVETVEQVDRFEELRSFLLYNGSPSEIQTALVQILGTNAETPFFFQTTVFLKGARMTAPTRETTPGQ